ncbi:helix-turn-helix transcriptional regulator [Sphaerisporangium sp. TRM90804]|uniref:helix-turn-helix domain-containing protein n=1 Tax=Sphaerisporangium sp. TRM90804 TaxID=3031113 RepID=UPI00244C70DF|nr:helix-turn-helix transcriptional regulator [Sphaerisporangium sp. TRM90804]MDH2426838.1 helix-turn-helix transcriptional regulator [Sphaerisporangium sp. TRM90804]
MSEPTAGEDLAGYLRHLKKKTGRSYDALAKRLGVGKSTLHRYCSGDGVPPRFTLLERFAKECHASQAEIIELHRRWVRAQAPHEAEAELTENQPADPPDDRAAPPDAPPAAPPVPPSPAKRSRVYPPFLRKRRTGWALAGMAVLVMAVVLIWRPGSDLTADAESAHACTERRGVKQVDGRQGGHAWTRDFVCVNRTDTPLYRHPDSTEKVAVLDTPKSWFVCWQLGRVQADGGRVWYYTRGDRSEPGRERWEGWGFVGAEHVTAPTHPVANMPPCGNLR